MDNKQPTSPRDMPTIIIVWRDRLSLLKQGTFCRPVNCSVFHPRTSRNNSQKKTLRFIPEAIEEKPTAIFLPSKQLQLRTACAVHRSSAGEIVPACCRPLPVSVLRKLKVKNKTIAQNPHSCINFHISVIYCFN